MAILLGKFYIFASDLKDEVFSPLSSGTMLKSKMKD